jgi:hypothetical protein
MKLWKVRLTRLWLNRLGAPLVSRQLLVLSPPLLQTLGLVNADGASAEHLATDVAVHCGWHFHRPDASAAAAAATASVWLFLLTASPDYSILHI